MRLLTGLHHRRGGAPVVNDDWHGWSVDDVAYSVGKHPARKSVALMRSHGGVMEAAAYFRTEEAARAFLAWLDGLVVAPPPHSCSWTGSGVISHDARCSGCGKRYGDQTTRNGSYAKDSTP